MIKSLMAIITILPKDALKRVADSVLDIAEDAIKDSKNKIDDLVAMPLVKGVRVAFDIPDND